MYNGGAVSRALASWLIKAGGVDAKGIRVTRRSNELCEGRCQGPRRGSDRGDRSRRQGRHASALRATSPARLSFHPAIDGGCVAVRGSAQRRIFLRVAAGERLRRK